MPDFAAWLGSGVEAIDAPADADALAATLVSRLATPPMEVRAGGGGEQGELLHGA